MLHSLFRLLSLLVCLWAIPVAVTAQSIPTGESTSDLTAAVREAADAGVSVIVIDGQGQLLSGPPTSEDGEDETHDPMATASPLMQAQSEIDEFRHELKSRLAALPYSIFEVQYVLRETSPDGRLMTFVEVVGWCVLLLLFGRWVSVELYGKRIARRYVVSRIMENPQGYSDKMPFLVFRFFMGLVGTIVAMVFAYVAGYLIFGAADELSIEFTVTAVFTAFFLARTVSDMWRMVLSPFLSQYRIPFFSDRDAKRLYIWASALATYDIVTVVFSTWVADFGLNYNVYAMVYGATTLVGSLLNIAMILFNARAITGAMLAGRRREDVSWVVRVLTVAWAPFCMFYAIFGWLELAFDLVLERPVSVPLIAGTYIVLMTIITVYGIVNFVIERYFSRSREIRQMNEEAEAVRDAIASGDVDDLDALDTPTVYRHPISSFEELARRAAGILAFAIGLLALLSIWDPDLAWLKGTYTERLVDVIVIIFIGYLVYHFFRIWIDGKIAEETSDVSEAELGDEGGAAGASRLATLLPLFRGAILAIVVVSIGLIALMELGVNVSPLFAGAGVVGLAVGFGSQTLVRDIFSGAFFLVDDAFRKGEYIDIGDVKGTVEKISVRSFQLRHHLGALHTIPFGEIKVLTNYSRDWVIMKLPLRVTYDTDVEKVRKLVKKLGQELLTDPVIGDNFIQPLKSQGVIEMQDSAMIIRVKFMTKPGDQWLVRKKVFQDIREMFEREGIKFAHREVTVRLADEQAEKMTPKQKEAAVGAVQAAIDEDMMADLNEGGDDR
ncbi:mechanosensitive ion channel [Aliisedimentitalea scapharcae]|uniref:Mechanosensitive ion channel n=1 Tax=Aliisedimentitalea scapharcae TaxID=1524259 RepID=A0ABZ2XVU4_9RHOB